MFNKKVIIILISIISVFSLFIAGNVMAQPGDDRNPTNTGKCVDAGTVQSIDTEKKLLIVKTINHGILPLQVNNSTEIKIGDNFLNFEDVRMNDNIGFEGYWSGTLVSANNILVLEGPPSSYFALGTENGTTNNQNNQQNNNDSNQTWSGQNIQKGTTSSQALSQLEIIKVIVRKGATKINIRVRSFNNGGDIKEKFALLVYIRSDASSQYELIKTFQEKYVKSQNYLSRDVFIVQPSSYLSLNAFQVKAELVDSSGNVFYTFEQEYAGKDIL